VPRSLQFYSPTKATTPTTESRVLRFTHDPVNECNGDVSPAIAQPTRCEYRIYGQIRAKPKKNSYFATHTTKVSSSGSLCPVICQQPGVGMLRTVPLYAPSWCAQQQEAGADTFAVSGGAEPSSLLPVTAKCVWGSALHSRPCRNQTNFSLVIG
jgi:hypothetical protein